MGTPEIGFQDFTYEEEIVFKRCYLREKVRVPLQERKLVSVSLHIHKLIDLLLFNCF